MDFLCLLFRSQLLVLSMCLLIWPCSTVLKSCSYVFYLLSLLLPVCSSSQHGLLSWYTFFWLCGLMVMFSPVFFVYWIFISNICLFQNLLACWIFHQCFILFWIINFHIYNPTCFSYSVDLSVSTFKSTIFFEADFWILCPTFLPFLYLWVLLAQYPVLYCVFTLPMTVGYLD